MKIFQYIVFFVLATAGSALAQDSTRMEKKGIFETVRDKINNTRKPIAYPQKTASHHRDSLVFVADTLNSQKIISSLSPNDTLTRLQNKIENKTSLPAAAFHKTTDSLRRDISAPLLKPHTNAAAEADQLELKAENAETKLNVHLDQAGSKVDNVATKVTDGNVKVPDQASPINSPELSVPAQVKDIPSMPDVRTGVPEIPLPEVDAGASKPTLDIKSPENKVPDELSAMEKIPDMSGQLNKIESKLKVGEGYKKDIGNLANGDISPETVTETVEQKASELTPLSDFNSETQKITAQQQEYEALIQKYKNKKLFQEEVERKARNVVNDKLNKYSPAFKDAQAQLAKAKKLNPDVKSYRELKRKRINEMEDKPVYERFLPGVAIQGFSANGVFTMDWVPQCGYKLTGRWLVGTGGILRTSFSEKHKTWVKGESVYGYRTYLNFGLLKSFYAHGEFTALYGTLNVNNAELKNAKTFGATFGLGKRYDISHKLEGSILVLYNGHLSGHVVNVQKLAMRMEFNIKTKKRKKLF